MNCHKVRKKLSAFQDGELNAREHAQLCDHLENCTACQKQYTEMERIWQDLGDFREMAPGPGFYGQLVKKIRQPGDIESAGAFLWPFRFFSSPWAASALLIAGVLVGSFLGNILAQSDFFPLRQNQVSHAQAASEAFSLKVFGPIPPGSLADQFMRVASIEGGECR